MWGRFGWVCAEIEIPDRCKACVRSLYCDALLPRASGLLDRMRFQKPTKHVPWCIESAVLYVSNFHAGFLFPVWKGGVDRRHVPSISAQ